MHAFIALLFAAMCIASAGCATVTAWAWQEVMVVWRYRHYQRGKLLAAISVALMTTGCSLFAVTVVGWALVAGAKEW